MRILFLTHRLPYAPNRGDRTRALHMLKFLADYAAVHLVSLMHDQDEACHAADLNGLAASIHVAPVSRLRGCGRAIAAAMTGRPFTHALLDARTVKGICRDLVEKLRPDVVLAYCSGMARFALAPPLDSVPMVLDLVDVDSEKWRALTRTAAAPRRWIYAAEARRLRLFEARAARAAHTVLVVNERERALLLRIQPRANVLVVPNGVALEDFHPPSDASPQPRVAFCGVMNYPPNTEAALWFARRVWPAIRSRRPDARFTIVGSNPTPPIRHLPSADPTIEVTGAVPDVRPYLWQSAVAAAPLFVARGVQNKVLEAVAAGLPCVVTPAVQEGLPPEVLPACAVARDATEFAAAVLMFLERSPEERRGLAERVNLRPLAWNERLHPLLDALGAAARAGEPHDAARQPVLLVTRADTRHPKPREQQGTG